MCENRVSRSIAAMEKHAHHVMIPHRHRPRRTRSLPAIAALLTLLAGPLQARESALQDALEAALARAASAETSSLSAAGDWLSGLPSFTVAYYDSNERLGTDEAELILSLPFKSAARRRLDDSLQALDGELAGVREAHRRWVYSGLVRERAWALRLADLREAAIADKLALLTDLSARIRRLAERGAVPAYRGLIVEREVLAMQLESARLSSERHAALAAWEALTGSRTIPAELTEPDAPPGAMNFEDHPALQLLDQVNRQQQTLLALDAPGTAGWNLGLVARNFDGPEFTDRQYGVSLDLPLSFTGVENAGNLSARRSASREYLLERDRLLLALRSEWERLRAEAELLRRRQQLLLEAEQLADRIQAQLERLDASSELEAELLLQRMLDVLDTRAEASLTGALIGRNDARLRQAAGRSL